MEGELVACGLECSWNPGTAWELTPGMNGHGSPASAGVLMYEDEDEDVDEDGDVFEDDDFAEGEGEEDDEFFEDDEDLEGDDDLDDEEGEDDDEEL